jgi:hypothetical protein
MPASLRLFRGMTGTDHWADLVVDQAPIRFDIENSSTDAVT